jgi:hypothetical protein
MLFLTLRVAAHQLESMAALRAIELVDRHGARPPESDRLGCLYLTLDPGFSRSQPRLARRPPEQAGVAVRHQPLPKIEALVHRVANRAAPLG